MREAAGDARLAPAQASLADAGLKTMMPIGADDGGAGTPSTAAPFLDYVMDALADAGCRDLGLVIGPEHAIVRNRYTRDLVPSRIQITWLVQEQPLGTADAVLTAEPWTRDGPFLVVNGDNLYPVDVLRGLRDLDGPGLAAFSRDALLRSGNIDAERAGSFALIETDADGWLTDIVEKPGAAAMTAAGPRALVSMNCWRFDRRIFAACRDVPRSARNERELPDAVRLALGRGMRFKAFPASGEVLDLSRRTDVASVSRSLGGRVPRL
jgi:glucose-1-phosphate thymidylyltransferase